MSEQFFFVTYYNNLLQLITAYINTYLFFSLVISKDFFVFPCRHRLVHFHPIHREKFLSHPASPWKTHFGLWGDCTQCLLFFAPGGFTPNPRRINSHRSQRNSHQQDDRNPRFQIVCFVLSRKSPNWVG